MFLLKKTKHVVLRLTEIVLKSKFKFLEVLNCFNFIQKRPENKATSDEAKVSIVLIVFFVTADDGQPSGDLVDDVRNRDSSPSTIITRTLTSPTKSNTDEQEKEDR